MKLENKSFLVGNFKTPRRDLSFDSLFAAVTPYMESVNTSVSLGLYLCLKYKDYSSYQDFDVDPSRYDDHVIFHHDYQCTKLFSKSEFFPKVVDPKKEAEASFIKAEMVCRETNVRFSTRVDPGFRNPAISSVLHTATRKIARILGDVPDLADLNFRFGPGNAVGLSKNTDVFNKLNAELTLTHNLAGIAPEILGFCPGWLQYRADRQYTNLYDYTLKGIKVVGGSKLGFVPKTSKTDRAICTEPLLNSFVQLGVGDYMFRRLRKFGCNLRDQTRNQELARIGSLTDSLATIDLSAASDTISYMTVLELLPLPWFNLLDTCRSPTYTYEGETYDFNKFSSMGNGFTFPLESLIFHAVSLAVCSHLGIQTDQVSIYGDDIIIPCKAVLLLREVLTFLGFSVNESKSFSSGPFRESCGKDWFLGALVRPIFLKKSPTNEILMSWSNHIRRMNVDQYDLHFDVLYDCLKKLVPKPYHRLVGPDGFGDGHFIGNYELGFDNLCSYNKRGWEGRGYYTLGSSPITSSTTLIGVASTALYLAQFSASPTYRSGRLDNLYLLIPEVVSDSQSSKEGRYQITQRGRTRAVLRLAFHPWN